MSVTSAVLLRNRIEFKSIIDQSITSKLNQPKVSICVPARNEEKVIEKCVRSLLNQSYENFEILVLDDNSEDSTPSILQHLNIEFDHLTIIQGQPKPDDWLGKSWACHQLSQKTTGDILIFLDADVWMHSNILTKAVSKLEEIDVLTIWPQQKVHSFLEKLVVPTIYFSLLTLLPVVYVERSPRWMPKFLSPLVDPKFVAACGQFIAFKKSAYDSIDGHRGVKKEIVEDVELARRLKNTTYTISMMNGIGGVYCRMYTSGSETWDGFQKNFLAGFGNLFEFVFMAILHFLFFLFPIYLFVNAIIKNDSLVLLLSGSIISVYIVQRLILNFWFKWDWWMALLHPVAVIWFEVLGIKCMTNHIFGLKSIWKGRSV